LNSKKPEFIKDVSQGEWFNNVTNNVYGEAIQVIVLKFEHMYIEWLPNRGGFKGYHSPENADKLAVDKTFGAWKMASGNDLQESYAYMCLVVGHEQEGVVVLSFTSSGLKIAREWNRLMTTHIMDNGKRALPYYLTWNLGVSYNENEKGSWYLPKVSFAGYITPEQYAVIQPERKLLPSKNVDYSQIGANEAAPQVKEIEGKVDF